MKPDRYVVHIIDPRNASVRYFGFASGERARRVASFWENIGYPTHIDEPMKPVAA